MKFLRKIDSAILDRVQTWVEAISARTGSGKQGILRDLNIGSAMVHACCALAVVATSDMIVKVLAVMLVGVCLARALDHAASARTENTPDRWADAAAEAIQSRDGKVNVRLWIGACTTSIVLMAILFAPRLVETLQSVGVGHAPVLYSTVLFMATDMVREYLDAVQPPRPGKPRERKSPARSASVEASPGI